MSLRDGVSTDELRWRLDIERISEVVRWARLRWFGHVERITEYRHVEML